MRKRLLLFCLLGAGLWIGLTTGSCKKNNTNYIQTLFTGGQWQLASLVVTHYVGDTVKVVDTLNTNCNLNQLFTFNSDLTCTYTNFDCLQQSATGHWSLSQNQLYLAANVTFKDTTAAGSSAPFANAQIINLGQYSLILRTGDLEAYYPPNKIRVIAIYGFVRVKTQ